MAPCDSPVRLTVRTGLHDKRSPPHSPTSASALTPPVTPIGKGVPHTEPLTPSPTTEDPSRSTQSSAQTTRDVGVPIIFPDEIDICHDESRRPFEFGRGAWSIVYRARSVPKQSTGSLHTPPSSPASTGRILAVKAPLRRDAHKVLQSEALTMTRLSLTPGCENYMVPFHGFLPEYDALVMSAIPLALSTFIEDKADARKHNPSTATMFEPVQGPESWRDMARKLITCLAWLHDTAGLVHGDIKPHNVLLRPTATHTPDAFPFEPLLADFSSAYEIPSDSSSTSNVNQAALSAFTPPFTAPELLSLASLRSGEIAPLPSSDVFSLAATLIAAATGDLLLYPGSNNFQRLAMAKDGHRILDFTRAGSNGCRIPRYGFVEKLIQPAVVKDPTQRILTGDWVALASC
ncbi:Uncharacterized protein PECH_000030 [Penicillium ucsense]|uniref:Protein kinase domain-containing protein n=1 Tax=Penicillium ucsense TaxID=2839758 RepID=A0A8J8WH81_9EURO|nr:Uncharacterized protein PECM_007744 [Penicillium ucsense]KAF7739518.1 Uncharacterized protein PECH_000030 [Penicillium ucsense]